MNIKKFLSSTAKADRESLKTKNDDLFIEGLLAKQDTVPKRRLNRKRFFAIGIPCVSLLLALIICLSIMLPFNREILYLAENNVIAESTLDELNHDLKSFQLEVASDGREVTVNRVYDSESSDTLYYRVEIVTLDLFPQNLSLVVVANEHFHYKDSTLHDDYKSEMLNENELRYSIEIDSTPEIDIYTVEGEMQINSEWLYITYNEIVLSGMECNFLLILEEIIQIK